MWFSIVWKIYYEVFACGSWLVGGVSYVRERVVYVCLSIFFHSLDSNLVPVTSRVCAFVSVCSVFASM